MLQSARLVVVEARLPRDPRALVHRTAVLEVEGGRVAESRTALEPLGTQLRVAVPQRLVRREGVDHPRPLALPLLVLLPVEEPVGQVVLPHDGERHQPGDLAAWTGEAQYGAREDALAVGALRRAAGALVGLRVVDQDERRTDARAVGALVLHAADAAGDPADAHDGARGGRPRDGRQHDLTRGPSDVRLLAHLELAARALVDPLKRADREAHLREVVEEEVVVLELGLDRLEHARGVLLVAADECHELPVPVEERPEAGRLAEARLSRAAGHRHREEPALEDGVLDAADDAEVVVAPGEPEGLREVPLAEGAEVGSARGLPRGVGHLGKLADVAARERELRVALTRPLAVELVAREPGRHRWLRLRAALPSHGEPCDVAEEVDALAGAVVDAKASAVAVALKHALARHLAERRRVEDAAELARAEPARIEAGRVSHRRPPSS